MSTIGSGLGLIFGKIIRRGALNWARFIQAHPTWFKTKVTTPFVLGAIIDLGNCLDLTETYSLELVRAAYEEMKVVFTTAKSPLPRNEKGHTRDEDLVKRKLDCAVINFLHVTRDARKLQSFDTVRGAFFEGEPLFEGAGFRAQTHIQLCVRDHKRIRGYFRPIPE